MDPVAAFDQTQAALGTQADMLQAFREALIQRGFDRSDAQELVAIWYNHALTLANERFLGGD